MIKVYMYDAIIAEFPLDTYYADPGSAGRLNIRTIDPDEIFESFENGEWTDVKW